MSLLTHHPLIEGLATLVVIVPVWGFIALGLTHLAKGMPGERAMVRITMTVFGITLLASLGLVVTMALDGVHAVRVSLGEWFRVGEYGFELHLLVDRLSAPLMVLTSALCGIVGHFSSRYLHREAGAKRFMALLIAFAGGMQMIVMAGSLDLLFVGWEVVGIVSVLLIGFFHDRETPVRHALRTFVVYRICDVGLISAAVLLHHFAGTADFTSLFGASVWPNGESGLDALQAWEVAALLLFASMGKSAQLPFSGWLPRAMEGPTPSSAIFYGALSAHAGAFLLLRFAPVLEAAPGFGIVIVTLGIATALHGTLVGRVQSNVKSVLSYATITQLGILYVEIGLGLHQLALVHMLGHAALRSVQLLRAPSVLSEHAAHRALVGPMLGRTGAHFERILPKSVRDRAYARALDEHHLEAWTYRVIRPVVGLLSACDRVERAWTAWLGGASAAPPATTGEPAYAAGADGKGR